MKKTLAEKYEDRRLEKAKEATQADAIQAPTEEDTLQLLGLHNAVSRDLHTLVDAISSHDPRDETTMSEIIVDTVGDEDEDSQEEMMAATYVLFDTIGISAETATEVFSEDEEIAMVAMDSVATTLNEHLGDTSLNDYSTSLACDMIEESTGDLEMDEAFFENKKDCMEGKESHMMCVPGVHTGESGTPKLGLWRRARDYLKNRKKRAGKSYGGKPKTDKQKSRASKSMERRWGTKTLNRRLLASVENRRAKKSSTKASKAG